MHNDHISFGVRTAEERFARMRHVHVRWGVGFSLPAVRTIEHKAGGASNLIKGGLATRDMC